MKDFKFGVKYYTLGKLETQVGFPENQAVCGYCPFVKSEFDLKRHRCLVTDEMLYSLEIRGRECPLKFSGEIEEVE